MSTHPPNSSSHSSSNDVKLPMYLVHSDLDEYGLNPYEFRVYAHIVRRTGGQLTGACFSRLELMAKICKILEGLQLSTGASWELNCESRDIQIEPV